MNHKNLPPSWTIAKFEDLLDYIQPTEYIVASTEYDNKYKTPVLTAGKSFIKGYTNETNGIFNSVPVIIFDDFTTATQYVNFPFKVKSSAMKILQPTSDLVNIKLAFYFMQTVHLKSETHKRYWISEYSKLPIPLPPEKEQQRIFDKIEELITGLDKGIEYLETAQQQLKVYRQSVLKWAFEGKLTKDVPEWEIVKLEKVAEVIDPHPSHRTPPVSSDGISYVSTKDFDYESDKIYFEKSRKVSKNILNEHLARYQLEIGDFVIGKIGTIGQPVRVVLPQDYVLSANIVLIQPRKVDRKYLYYYFQSNQIESLLRKGQKATAQAAFGIQKVRVLPVPLPSKKEQRKIVLEIESRLSVCDKIEEILETSLQQAEALRLSIIKKGFEGKLVKQNPKDLSAEILLAKIKAEKNRNYPDKPGEKIKTKKYMSHRTTASYEL